MLKAVKKIGVKGVAVLSGRHAFITRLTKPVYIDKKKKKMEFSMLLVKVP